MQIVHDIRALRAALDPQCGKRVALVPTMGHLHAGHLALVQLARSHADIVVVSIFVNPLQFGVGEDFSAYPRTLLEDCDKLQKAGVDLVFAPTVIEMYPEADDQGLHQSVLIQPPAFADQLCGAHRPGHFAGVATVVTKLFHLVRPQMAVFGKKDYQQLMVIHALVRQLNFPIEIIAGETSREASGLAMSSRNAYLTETQTAQAPQLYGQLQRIAQALLAGERGYLALEHSACKQLQSDGWQVDYVAIRNPVTLTLPRMDSTAWVMLAAAKLGNTRLIDNLELAVSLP